MKKGETSEFKEAQENMQRIFSKIQESPALQQAYSNAKNGNSVSGQSGISTQLVNLAVMLDSYMDKTKDKTL
jgi:hypothetical protein